MPATPLRHAALPLLLAAAVATTLATAGCASGARARRPDAAAEPPAVAALRARLRPALDSLRAAQRFPGATLALALADGRTIALATGYADTARKVPLRTTDLLLQGSVGKTYVSAVAMQLVAEGRLDVDAPLARWFGSEPWFDRLPNARDITVRQLMTHTSGLVRYEFDPRATAVLRAEPMKTWTPLDRLQYLFGTRAPFAAGQGWDYSDTNYIVLGMIIERITGRPYYAELLRRVLVPLGLAHTVPSDRPDLPGLANGYAGPKNDLGGYDASLDAAGRLRVNPQFEWTGGGVASTTEDLARWGKLLYEGRAFDAALVRRMVDAAVPARLGPNVKYGLGVIVRPTALGEAWGHSGFFPGYATELLYFPELKIAAAIQVNGTDPYPRGLVPFLVRAATEARDAAR
jgi:D-alanyl-D-alanine carboxypeptidase